MKIYEITFSPTGGTKKVADTLSRELGEEIVEVDLTNPKEDFSKYNISPEDLAVIAVPSYGGRAPETAIERLKELNGNSAKAALTVVYGNRDYEDTLIELSDAAIEAGFSPIAGVAAIAEHSILPQYATGRPDQADQNELTEFAKRIKARDRKGAPNIPGNRPYKKTSNLPLTPKPTSACTSCNLCVTLCPVEAIDPKTYKVDKKKCISCMRCVRICPVSARKLNKMMTGAASLALKNSASDRKNNELFL